MKNKLFQKYYKNKYAQMKDLYIDLIKNLTIITPSLNKTVTNFFDEIINEQAKYSTTNWTKNIDEKISLYYSNIFPNNLINNYFNFIKKNITKASNNTYFEANIDTFINHAELSISSSDIISNLVQEIVNGNYKNYDFNISIQNSDGNINNEEIKETLENLNIKQYDQIATDIKNEANTIKNNFLNKLNYTFEDYNLENKIKSHINNTIYSTYTYDDTLDIMTNPLFSNINITDNIEKIHNFMKMAYDMSSNYYKTIYAEIAKYYKSIIEKSNNFPLYDVDFIEDKFGELGGYSLINGLNHLDPVCDNNDCPYKIDMKSLKEGNRRNRRLSENNISKEIKDIVNLMKEIKNIIKDMPYIKDEESEENTQLRKLTILSINSILSIVNSFQSNKKYDSSSPSMDKKNVESVLPSLTTLSDSFNNFIFNTAKKFDNYINNKFSEDELFNLVTKCENYLNDLKDNLNEDDYKRLNKYLSFYMNKINNYVSNKTNSILKLSELYVDKINDLYVENQITGSMVNNKVLHYYDILEKLINNKYKVVEEKEYKAYNSLLRRNEQQNFDKEKEELKEGYKLVDEKDSNTEKQIFTEKKLSFGFYEKDESLPDIMQDDDIDYDWDDKDNINEETKEDEKGTNFMYKDPDRIAKKKEERNARQTTRQTQDSDLEKKCKKLKKKMDEYHLKAETEISFEWGKKVEANTNLAWEWDKTLKLGWQFPFCLPVLPAIQFRIGIKIELYFKITVALQLNFKAEKENDQWKDSLDLNFIVDLSFGIKMDVTAQVGAFFGFLSAYGGIDGTLLEAKVQVKFSVYIFRTYYEFYVALTISCLKFRIYAEALVKISLIFHTIKIKKTLYEKLFGLESPVLYLYYYVKLDFFCQVMDEKKFMIKGKI